MTAPAPVARRLLQLAGEPEIIHDQPARFVLERAVASGDGSYQPVPTQRFVHVQ